MKAIPLGGWDLKSPTFRQDASPYNGRLSQVGFDPIKSNVGKDNFQCVLGNDERIPASGATDGPGWTAVVEKRRSERRQTNGTSVSIEQNWSRTPYYHQRKEPIEKYGWFVQKNNSQKVFRFIVRGRMQVLNSLSKMASDFN